MDSSEISLSDGNNVGVGVQLLADNCSDQKIENLETKPEERFMDVSDDCKMENLHTCSNVDTNISPAKLPKNQTVKKSGTIALRKLTDHVSGDKFKKPYFSKVSGSAGGVTQSNGNGISNGKARVGKTSDIRVGTVKQHEITQKSQSNFTVPQPFALETDRRATLGGQSKPHQAAREDEKRTTGEKEEDPNHNEAKMEEAKGQLRASINTFNFNSDVRAQRRKEFNSKMEERLTAREAEKTQALSKTKENMQEEIKKFRKSLTFKATPMPSFYQESAPPKSEIKKIPPTRARSPKLGRRNSIEITRRTSRKSKEESSDSPDVNQSRKENNVQVKVGIKTRKSLSSSKRVLGVKSNTVTEKEMENRMENDFGKCEVASPDQLDAEDSEVKPEG